MNPNPIQIEEIREQALNLGWDDVGITEAFISEENIRSYLQWLENGFQGDLAYMENQIRCYPDKIFPGAKSAIIFVSNYKQPKVDFIDEGGVGVIASYARGKDYHNVHRKRLKKFILWLENRSGQEKIAKGFSDSTPILEKALAVQAGLGWFGKNTLLIHRKFGTFTLLSGVLTTLEFDNPSISARLPRCGICTRCLDACPTQAFISPYKLDATKCLSYHLIESKKELPDFVKEKNPGYVFGCDICQDVCPHNVRKKEANAREFSAESGIGSYLTLQNFQNIETNPEILYGTPLQRRGVKGLKDTLNSLENK